MTTLEIIITISAVLLLIFILIPSEKANQEQREIDNIYLSDCNYLSNVDMHLLQDPVFIGFLREYKIFKDNNKYYKVPNI